METIAALGLAGNIIQFVDFAFKVLNGSHKLYESTTGATAENEIVEGIARDLKILTAPFASSSEASLGPNPVKDIASQCQCVADDLLGLLEKIKLKSPHKKWHSFVQALRGTWKKEEIDEMFQRLERLRDQLLFHLQIMLNMQQPDLQAALTGLIAESNEANRTDSQKLENSINELRDSVNRLERGMKQIAAYRRDSDDEFATACVQGVATLDWETLSQDLLKFATNMGTSKKEQKLLDSLWFYSIEDRKGHVSSAHEATFSWALDPSSKMQLYPWLKSGDGVFWIRGKAGSGKSTLMKFLVDHESVAEALRLWAGQKELRVASFFFWNAGTELQKSLEGLLRSLLFEVLSQCPKLIGQVCKFKLKGPRAGSYSWTLRDLWRAIEGLILTNDADTRFCFFVDGLDEYNGSPDDVVETLERLRRWSNIKLCISSRPWNEFIDAYGQPSDLFLTLEQITRPDIELYVRNKLEENKWFRALKAKDPSCQEIVEEVVDKAHGVFLWVMLVVRSLLSGLRNADRICDLQRRLRGFPESLESFFHQMLASVEPIYKEQMAKTFAVALAAEELLSVVTYSFIDEEQPHARRSTSILAPTSDITLSENRLLDLREEMERRLNSRCKGLLEIVTKASYHVSNSYGRTFSEQRVDFIHRTARDYLLSKYASDLLAQHLSPDFDVNLCMAKAIFASLMSFDYRQFSGLGLEFRENLFSLIKSSLQINSHVEQKAILNDARIFAAARRTVFADSKGDHELLQLFARRGAYETVDDVLVEDQELARTEGYGLLIVLTKISPLRPKAAHLVDTIMRSGISVLEKPEVWDDLLRNLTWSSHQTEKEVVRDMLKPVLSRVGQAGVRFDPSRSTCMTTSDPVLARFWASSIPSATLIGFFGEEQAYELLEESLSSNCDHGPQQASVPTFRSGLADTEVLMTM